MFAKTIIDSDEFLDMPVSTQNLYFHLGMKADDEGVVNNYKSIMRCCRALDDDLKILIAKKFIIPIQCGESAIVVIKHWKINNYIQNDRFHPSNYHEAVEQLEFDENNAYRLPKSPEGACIQDGYQTDTEVRLGKVRLGKDSIGDNIICDQKSPKTKRFTPPTLDEVKDYCFERGNNVDAEKWYDYYSSNGWKVGKNPMKDWKAAVRTWERSDYNNNRGSARQVSNSLQDWADTYGGN